MLLIHEHWTSGQQHYNLCPNEAYRTRVFSGRATAAFLSLAMLAITLTRAWGPLSTENSYTKMHKNVRNGALNRLRHVYESRNRKAEHGLLRHQLGTYTAGGWFFSALNTAACNRGRTSRTDFWLTHQCFRWSHKHRIHEQTFPV